MTRTFNNTIIVSEIHMFPVHTQTDSQWTENVFVSSEKHTDNADP